MTRCSRCASPRLAPRGAISRSGAQHYVCTDCGEQYWEYVRYGHPVAKPEPLEELLYAEPIIGWRFWNVRRAPFGEPRLFSVTRKVVWEPRKALRAVHETHPPLSYQSLTSQSGPSTSGGDAPCEWHGCGIYAFKTEERWLESLRPYYPPYALRPVAVGEVYLWGRIYEHEFGYRAQYAYPKRLIFADEVSGEELARIYNIPYEESPTWRSGRQSDESLRNRFILPNLYANLLIQVLLPIQPSQIGQRRKKKYLPWPFRPPSSQIVALNLSPPKPLSRRGSTNTTKDE